MQWPGITRNYATPGLCLQPFDAVNQSKILLGSARSDPGDILQVHDIDGKPLEDITALDGLVTQSGSVFSAGGNFYTLPTNKIVKINGATGETTYNVARAHPVSCGDGTYLVGIEFFYSGLPLYNWVTVYFYSAVDGSYLGALESNHVLRSTTLIQRVAIVPSAGGFVVYVGLSGSKFQTGYCTYSGGWNPDPTGQSKVTWSGVLEPEACLETANYTVFIVHIGLVGDYDVIYTAKGGVNSIRFLLSLGINIDHITTAFVILGTDTIVFNGCNEQIVKTYQGDRKSVV